MNAARASTVHRPMTSTGHPIVITAGTNGALYISGLADDPIEVITRSGILAGCRAYVDGMEGLVAEGATARDACDALRDMIVEYIAKPEALFRFLAAKAGLVATEDDPEVDDMDRAVAVVEEQAYLSAARILFAAKQVAQHEAAQHTARREAAHKAGVA